MCTATPRPRIGPAIIINVAAALLLCASALAADTAPGSSGAAATSSTDTAADKQAHATLLDIARYFGQPTAKQRWMSLLFTLTRTGEWEEQQYLDQFVAALRSSNAGKDLSGPPVPTGDVLFDRYALAVDAQLSNALLPDMDTLHTACLPDEQLAAWEGEFGGDPRYWELRYMCAWSRYYGGSPTAEDVNPRVYLEEAQRRGVASANTLLLLYGEVRSKYGGLLEQVSKPREWPGAGPGDASTPEDEPPGEPAGETVNPAADPARVERYLRVSRKAEEEEISLLDAAVAKDPGCAWAYYERAMYWFELGEQQRGLADLEAGNAAPHCEYPRPFPFGVVARSLSAPAPAGSAAVSGAVCVESCTQSLPNFLRWKEHVRESLVAVNLSGDTRALEAWHQFGCRLAESAPDSLITGLVGVVLAGMVRSYMADEQADALDADQQETLARMLGAIEIAKDAVLNGSPVWEMEASFYLAELGGLRGFYCGFYLSNESEARSVQHIAQVMRDLSEVHYPALDTPDCLKKYEALTTEELQRRREAERAKRRESESPQVLARGAPAAPT